MIHSLCMYECANVPVGVDRIQPLRARCIMNPFMHQHAYVWDVYMYLTAVPVGGNRVQPLRATALDADRARRDPLAVLVHVHGPGQAEM